MHAHTHARNSNIVAIGSVLKRRREQKHNCNTLLTSLAYFITIYMYLQCEE